MVKVNFITLDEKTGTEKKSASFILVQASTVADALDKFTAGMKGSAADFEVASVAETPLCDVFPLNAVPGKPLRVISLLSRLSYHIHNRWQI